MRKPKDPKSPVRKRTPAPMKGEPARRAREALWARGPGRVEAHALVRKHLEKVLAGHVEGAPRVEFPADVHSPLARLLNAIRFIRGLGLRDISLQALGILIALYNSPADGIQEGLTFAEIAEQAGVQQSSVSKHTAQLGTFYTSGILCGFNLLEVFPDLIERGRLRAKLTPSGRGLLAIIERSLL